MTTPTLAATTPRQVCALCRPHPLHDGPCPEWRCRCLVPGGSAPEAGLRLHQEWSGVGSKGTIDRAGCGLASPDPKSKGAVTPAEPGGKPSRGSHSMPLQAIPTEYAGVRFRSRKEARWATFFDALKLTWEYEKEGFELPSGQRYVPDFWLPGISMWFEVKGIPDPRGYLRWEEFAEAQRQADNSKYAAYHDGEMNVDTSFWMWIVGRRWPAFFVECSDCKAVAVVTDVGGEHSGCPKEGFWRCDSKRIARAFEKARKQRFWDPK